MASTATDSSRDSEAAVAAVVADPSAAYASSALVAMSTPRAGTPPSSTTPSSAAPMLPASTSDASVTTDSPPARPQTLADVRDVGHARILAYLSELDAADSELLALLDSYATPPPSGVDLGHLARANVRFRQQSLKTALETMDSTMAHLQTLTPDNRSDYAQLQLSIREVEVATVELSEILKGLADHVSPMFERHPQLVEAVSKYDALARRGRGLLQQYVSIVSDCIQSLKTQESLMAVHERTLSNMEKSRAHLAAERDGLAVQVQELTAAGHLFQEKASAVEAELGKANGTIANLRSFCDALHDQLDAYEDILCIYGLPDPLPVRQRIFGSRATPETAANMESRPQYRGSIVRHGIIEHEAIYAPVLRNYYGSDFRLASTAEETKAEEPQVEVVDVDEGVQDDYSYEDQDFESAEPPAQTPKSSAKRSPPVGVDPSPATTSPAKRQKTSAPSGRKSRVQSLRSALDEVDEEEVQEVASLSRTPTVGAVGSRISGRGHLSTKAIQAAVKKSNPQVVLPSAPPAAAQTPVPQTSSGNDVWIDPSNKSLGKATQLHPIVMKAVADLLRPFPKCKARHHGVLDGIIPISVMLRLTRVSSQPKLHGIVVSQLTDAMTPVSFNVGDPISEQRSARRFMEYYAALMTPELLLGAWEATHFYPMNTKTLKAINASDDDRKAWLQYIHDRKNRMQKVRTTLTSMFSHYISAVKTGALPVDILTDPGIPMVSTRFSAKWLPVQAELNSDEGVVDVHSLVKALEQLHRREPWRVWFVRDRQPHPYFVHKLAGLASTAVTPPPATARTSTPEPSSPSSSADDPDAEVVESEASDNDG